MKYTHSKLLLIILFLFFFIAPLSSSVYAQNNKIYDLAERTLKFTRSVFAFANALPKSVSHSEVAKQVVRSAGSIGANYIEAEEALSKKDFLMRIKISRKEAKETSYWLKLIDPEAADIKTKESLIQESTELMKIFGSIITKSE